MIVLERFGAGEAISSSKKHEVGDKTCANLAFSPTEHLS